MLVLIKGYFFSPHEPLHRTGGPRSHSIHSNQQQILEIQCKPTECTCPCLNYREYVWICKLKVICGVRMHALGEKENDLLMFK